MLLGETRATGQDRHSLIIYPQGYIRGCEPVECSDISMPWAAEPFLGPISLPRGCGGFTPKTPAAPESRPSRSPRPAVIFSGILFGWSASRHFGGDPDGRPDGSVAVTGTCPMVGPGGMPGSGEMVRRCHCREGMPSQLFVPLLVAVVFDCPGPGLPESGAVASWAREPLKLQAVSERVILLERFGRVR